MRDVKREKHPGDTFMPGTMPERSLRPLSAALLIFLRSVTEAPIACAVADRHGESTRAPKCKGMERLLKEGYEIISEDAQDEVRDIGLFQPADLRKSEPG